MLLMIKKILTCNVVLYVAIFLLLAKTVDWHDCFIKRGKYLLGIVYNGNFQNDHDRTVYEDYLKRHGSSPEVFQKAL